MLLLACSYVDTNWAALVTCTLQAFDELLLLKRGGRTIYHGPLGPHSQLLIDYFMDVQGRW